MKKIIFYIFLIIPTLSYASNWVEVTKNAEGSSSYVDGQSIKRTGELVTFWSMLNFATKTKQGDLSFKALSTINCKTREIINKYFYFYDDWNGNGKATASFPNNDNQWQPIAPDTVNERLLEAICKK
jgi:hypothetical protein